MSVHAFTGRRMLVNVHGEPYPNLLQPSTVYAFFGGDGRALYIGCTSRPFSRFAEHTARDWWSDVARIDVEHFEDRSDALAYEREAIAVHLPRHNVAGIPEHVLLEREPLPASDAGEGKAA